MHWAKITSTCYFFFFLHGNQKKKNKKKNTRPILKGEGEAQHKKFKIFLCPKTRLDWAQEKNKLKKRRGEAKAGARGGLLIFFQNFFYVPES
jgi:hypothetical protein